MPLEVFSKDVLGDRLRMISDRESATAFDSVAVDHRDLQRNGGHLVTRLDEVGLLRAFSDTTMMVGIFE